MNLATESKVASTCPEAAAQRVTLLGALGARRFIELCVGPSLTILKEEAHRRGLECLGNDVDPRWAPDLLGDCLRVDWAADAVVYAPPLSKGCSGTREDSLGIDDVEPGYDSFLAEWDRRKRPDLAVLVLPARSLSTRRDRAAFWRLVFACRFYGEVGWEECLVGRRSIRKYVYLWIVKR